MDLVASRPHTGAHTQRHPHPKWVSPAHTTGTFSPKQVEVVLILADEERRAELGYMKGRAVALDDLENLMDMHV